MKVIIDISEDLVKDVVITALEGGSNYWYNIAKHNIDGDLYDGLFNQKNAKMLITDIETGEYLGDLTLEHLNAGLTLMARDHRESFSAIIGESYDANDADILLQLAVLGEVVYG